jgi:hypothetical protein
MSKKYLLIKKNEDGEPCSFYEQIDEILENPDDYGISTFLYDIPKEDPMYWKKGNALLLEIKVLKPVVKATAFKLED